MQLPGSRGAGGAGRRARAEPGRRVPHGLAAATRTSKCRRRAVAASLGTDGRSQICSFSIPLITIVATFVFKLFLPVVMFLFGLLFLLKLKFCIPLSVECRAAT